MARRALPGPQRGVAGGLRGAAVHQLKYEGWSRAAEALALPMRHLEPLTAGVSLLPIPLGKRRLRVRGYNQSERIATALGALTGAPVRCDVLRRVRETPTQTALTPEARHANVAEAFQAVEATGLSVVLVDDVFTTGATLASAGSGAGRRRRRANRSGDVCPGEPGAGS